MTYEMAVDYIEEIPKFTKKHTLEHTKDFLRRLGNPAVDRKIIHVAGTNGKGSVCAYLQAILMAEGKRCGFFTSPHLISINERIQVNHQQISNEAFLQVFEEVMQVVRQMEAEGIAHPSYFEFLFGMGMKAFSKTDVEYIILETGLGGRLDATNAVETPALCVITSISLDHTMYLGDTIEAIAGEKAGIIKHSVPVFYDGSSQRASEVIRKKAEQMQAPCREISKNAFEIREVDPKYIAFSRANAYDKDVIYRVSIGGCYQAMNAEIALQAAEYLLGEQEGRDHKLWRQALEEIHWEGRMEEIAPHITVDGAHNPGAVEAFVESVNALGIVPVIVFAAAEDKEYRQMVSYLCEHLETKAYVVTEIEDGRRIPAEVLAEVFQQYARCPVYCEKQIGAALKEAQRLRGDGEIYCVGSLYLAGAVKKYLAGGNHHA